jgi:hypothetical protein
MIWRKRFNLVRGITVPLGCAVVLGITAGSGGASNGLPSQPAHSIGGSGQWSVVGEQKNLDGTVVDTWRDSNGAVISARGLPGIQVTVQPETISHGSGQTVDHTVTIGLKRTLSKKGFSPQSGSPGGVRLANSFYNYMCYTFKSSDGHVTAYGCDNQYIDWARDWDWYMADQQQVSAKSDCSASYFCDHLRSVAEYESWISGNQVTQWEPSSTRPVGSCQNVTVSYTSQRTGVGYSQSSDICPNTLGPYQLGSTSMGAIWQGRPPDTNNYYESAESVDEIHNPPYIATTAYYYTTFRWCSWCF